MVTKGPDLAELRSLLIAEVLPGHSNDDAARRMWWAALATLQQDFLLPATADPSQEPLAGVWLAAPLPALYEPALLERLQGWVWAPPQQLQALLPTGAGGGLLPSQRLEAVAGGGLRRLDLRQGDGTDPLLLLITPTLQVALCLDGGAEARRLVVRFEPEVLAAALGLIDARLRQEAPEEAELLRRNLQQLGPLHSNPNLGQQFWPQLAERLAAMAPSLTLRPLVQGGGESAHQRQQNGRAVSGELALLEALTHEVRTPLATIRTLIRSLLRRQDLPAVVQQRLEHIDGECSEQIDRFGLIFLAAELQREPENADQQPPPLKATDLARTDLSALLLQLQELWQRQLARRGLELVLEIGAELPAVLSDPLRLETMLGGLIDRFSRSLPAGGTVTVSLQPAGARLKLHLASSVKARRPGQGEQRDRHRQLVGPVLSWDPTTGSLQLSRQATQRLFARLGGRLTERGESGLTVFFPIC
jgi:signal transduction histidine kinase